MARPINAYYHLQAAHSGKLLAVLGYKSLTNWSGRYREGDDDGKLWQLKNAGAEDATKFLILPVDSEHVAIVPKKGSKVLDISQDAHPVTAIGNALGLLGREVVLYRWHGGDNQRFKLASAPNGGFNIHARNASALWDVQFASHDFAEIITWKPTGANNQVFNIIEAEQLPIRPNPNNYPQRSVHDRSATPEATGLQMPPPMANPAFIGFSLIPFLFVDDPVYDRASQARYSPLYLLRREQMWKRVNFQHFDAGPSQHFSKEVITGVIDTFKTSVSQVLKMELAPKFGFKAAQNLGLDMTLNSELQISASSDYVFEQKTIEKIEYDTPKDEACAISVWVFIDRYTLARCNPASPDTESNVFQSEVVLPKTMRYAIGRAK